MFYLFMLFVLFKNCSPLHPSKTIFERVKVISFFSLFRLFFKKAPKSVNKC